MRSSNNIKHVAVGLISRKCEEKQTQYLLVKSKKNFGEFTGYWYPPGGHVEAGENEEKALIREIKEELGLNIEPIKKLAETSSDIADQVTHWWVCQILSNDICIDQSEIAEVGWFTEQDMKTVPLWPSTRKFMNQYIFQNDIKK
ncbi:MAG: NUDIX hydrolase [Candidatus Komeilibacteria bacterium]